MERSSCKYRPSCWRRLVSVICIASVIITSVAMERKKNNRFESKNRDLPNAEMSCKEVSLQYILRNLHFCSGCILNKKWVITAAHCVDKLEHNPTIMKIVSGTNVLKLNSGVEHYVREIIVHENYDEENSWINDIALIQIIDEFENTSSIDWASELANPSQELPSGEIGLVAGWGGHHPQNRRQLGTWRLKRVPVEIVSQETCAEAYEVFDLSIHEGQICTDVIEPGIAPCNGDSGGSLTFNDKLVGLVSWSYGCTGEAATTNIEMTFPTVYTRISEYLPWILANAIVLDDRDHPENRIGR